MAKFTLNDLQNGDFVLLRNGVIGVVIKDKEHFIYNDGDWDFVRRFHNDLTYEPTNSGYDIMKVCRTTNIKGFDSAKRAFDINYGIVYNREKAKKENAVEMTLDEICKALGKNIKIVKG